MSRSADPGLRQWWRELIDSFDPDRSTIADFCRLHDVSTASFYAWRRKLADHDEAQPSGDAASAFLPVQVIASRRPEVLPADPKQVQVHLPGGIRVDVPCDQQELLLALVTTVARPAEVTP